MKEREREREKKLTWAQRNAILYCWRHSLKGLFYLFIYFFEKFQNNKKYPQL